MMELCTESSHINPLPRPGLLLSLPPMSFCLFSLCLCHSVCCCCCLSFLSAWFLLFFFLTFAYFFTSPSLCLALSDRFCPISPITLQYGYPTASLYSICKSLIRVTACHFVLRVSHWHQQVANVTLAGRRVGTTEKGWMWDCRGGLYFMCLCHRRVRRRIKDRVSERDWVSGYSDGTESLFQDSGDRYPRCLRSQPQWAQ